MKKVDIRPVFCRPVHLNIRLACQKRNVIVEDINAFSCIDHLAVGIKAYDTAMMIAVKKLPAAINVASLILASIF